MTKPVSIFQSFQDTVSAYPENPFLHVPKSVAQIYDIAKTNYTYAEARQEVESLKHIYSDLHYGQGMRAGVALENRPEFFIHFLALNAFGISVLPLNPGLQTDELTYQIEHGECDFLIVHPSLEDVFRGVVTGMSDAYPVVTPECVSSLPGRDSPLGEVSVSLSTEAALLYTSGTTGRPKGCILTNEYFLAIGDLYKGLGGLCAMEDGQERLITPLPVTHMNALACSFMAMIVTGGCLIQLDRFHPRNWWQTVRESQATIMHYLGVMPAMLLNFPVANDENFSDQIKFAFGAGCDPKHHAVFEERFGVTLIEAWAMSETGAGAWITACHEPRHVGTRCFGQAPDGLDYKLIGEEGEDLEPGAPGELLVRRKGANPRQYFFSAYYKDPDATEEVWQDGWFHTGDVVRVDDEGYFYFVDRRKNVIRRSGENIAAIDVESVLMRHDNVSSCVVVPVPDAFRGDEVMALVVLAESDRPPDKIAQDIFQHAMEHLIYFKAPGYIAFVDALPMTASEKVKRGDAKKIAIELVEAQKCFDFCDQKKRSK